MPAITSRPFLLSRPFAFLHLPKQSSGLCVSKHHQPESEGWQEGEESEYMYSDRHELHLCRPARYGGSRISTLVLLFVGKIRRSLASCVPCKHD